MQELERIRELVHEIEHTQRWRSSLHAAKDGLIQRNKKGVPKRVRPLPLYCYITIPPFTLSTAPVMKRALSEAR